MDIKTRLDSNAKGIISNKSLIATLLKNEIEEYKKLNINEIEDLIEFSDGNYLLGIDNEDDFSGNRRIRYDLLLTPRLPNSNEKIGMYINVEMQNTDDDITLLKRAIYYSSSLIGRQPKDIKDFTYQKLKKVYSIWVCTNPRIDRRNTIIEYTLNATQLYGIKVNDINESDLLHIRFLNLSEAEAFDNSTIEILRLLFMHTGKTPKEVASTLNNNFGIIITEKEVNDMPGYGQYVYDTGYKKGSEQSLISSVVKLIHGGMSEENAFSILEVSDDIKKQVLEELKKDNK